jgi:hypothetical protein
MYPKYYACHSCVCCVKVKNMCNLGFVVPFVHVDCLVLVAVILCCFFDCGFLGYDTMFIIHFAKCHDILGLALLGFLMDSSPSPDYG